MPCDMCGNAKTEAVCSIEGSELTVCGPCSKYGQLVRRVSQQPFPRKKPVIHERVEKVEDIATNFSQLIRKSRESLKMTQEDFAKKIQEKVNTLHKWETGHLKPDLQTAKKLERMLNIKLVTSVSNQEEKIDHKSKSVGLTIGDILKVS
ncbi:MAG TPA: multiprotein bridging factor aMBF1 [Candidatus Nanoarchaeia archaeon]|nr:multiprotein bridging factor aMBF1 [Candidatus Nanoarchaeia archaeon]